MTFSLTQTQSNIEFFLDRVCYAYVLHKVSVHRRPVYRHQHGDIELSKHGLMGLLDGQLSELWNEGRRSGMYMKCLSHDFLSDTPYTAAKEGFLFSMGGVPALKPRAIRWIDLIMDKYGDMVHDIGGAEAFDEAIRESIK